MRTKAKGAKPRTVSLRHAAYPPMQTSLIPYVAIGYVLAGYVAGLLTFATLCAWVWRTAVTNMLTMFARKLDARGEVERAMHIRASLALLIHEWEQEDARHEERSPQK